MAIDASGAPPFPLPSFYFQVHWDSRLMSFQEVSGLDDEAQNITYRHSDSPTVSTLKMPGIRKFSNVTLKKGVCTGDNEFWDWFQQIKMNTIRRLPITISLMDERGAPTMN